MDEPVIVIVAVFETAHLTVVVLVAVHVAVHIYEPLIAHVATTSTLQEETRIVKIGLSSLCTIPFLGGSMSNIWVGIGCLHCAF